MLIALVVSGVGFLVVAVVFEGAYQTLRTKMAVSLQKHQWCWLWWSVLGVLSFAAGRAAGLMQMAITFCIASSHIRLCGVKEGFISPVEVVKNMPSALRAVYARFRRLLQERNGP